MTKNTCIGYCTGYIIVLLYINIPQSVTLIHAFQGENILQVELDMPNRTTRDYEGPSVAPKIQAVLDAALEDEGDIDIEDRSAINASCQYTLLH